MPPGPSGESPPAAAKATWRSKVREAWGRLRGGQLTPWRAAASVAVGLAIGVTPLFGLHLPLVLAVCVPLRLDAPVAYLAANISMPLIAPFLSFAEIEIGAWLRTGRGAPLSVAAIRANGIAGFLHELVLGTLVFSPGVALVGGAITFLVASRLRTRPAPDAMDAAVDRVAARYAGGRRAAYHYVRSKLAGDPAPRAIAARGPLGEVSDVGCGRGQLAVLLLENAAASKVTGFDWDAKKVEDARRASDGLPVRFEVGDVRTHPLAACDTVLLVDVLHYLTEEEQDALLTRAASAARERVIVRDLDPDRGWRSTVTRIQEGITTGLRWNRGARVRPRSVPDLSKVLETAGFDVRVEPCWGSTPFANVLLVGTRRGL